MVTFERADVRRRLYTLQRKVRMISVTELDQAIAAGKAELSRPNARPVRCAIDRCRRLCGVGQARQVWIDGHRRGFACQSCQWNQSLRQEERRGQETGGT
jgi:uncharacterized small protein (DUF1192 family)